MTDLPTHVLRFADLPARKASRFTLEPGATDCAALARALDLPALRRLRFSGTLAPLGRSDWRLTADLGASAQQLCGVTLAPVTARIDTPVTRRYVADWHDPEGDEVPMPEDTEAEPLPDAVDLYAVVLEELALALPAFPRADGVSIGSVQHAGPGITPMSDADARPFAGLAALKSRLQDE